MSEKPHEDVEVSRHIPLPEAGDWGRAAKLGMSLVGREITDFTMTPEGDGAVIKVRCTIPDHAARILAVSVPRDLLAEVVVYLRNELYSNDDEATIALIRRLEGCSTCQPDL